MRHKILARDALSQKAIKVVDTQRLRDIAAARPVVDVDCFIVVNDEGDWSGIVTSAEAALFPNRIFADLVARRQPHPVREDVPLDAILRRLDGEALERLAVCDEAGRPCGVISRHSLTETLFAYEHKIANLDLVTGLPNRNALQTKLAKLTSQPTSPHIRFAVAFIDLDNFKQVNDAFGHSAGDEMLRAVGHRLKAASREEDFVCRFGGDEFVALIMGHDSDDTLSAAVERLFEALNGHVRAGGREIFVTGSVGVTRYPEDGQDADSLLRQADLAMYRSKEAGREQVHYFARDQGQDISTRLTLANGLRKAYEAGEFWLAFQPQINLTTGKLIGAEVLMRCTSQELGPIEPATFIPIAEENGLIATLSDWALRQLAEEVPHRLVGRMPKGFRLAVNLSASQLNATTQDAILLASAALSAEGYRLEVELTESTLTREPLQALQLLTTLTRQGVSIAIDDFGTGFSNLSRLWDMPVDRLKISHDFTAELTTRDSRGFALVHAIIAFARALGIAVTAEGVEREEQASLLGELGCDEAQGYWYGRPEALDDFLDRAATMLPLTES